MIKRIALSALAALLLIVAQILLTTLFPAYGATPGTMIGSLFFLTVLFAKKGFKWMTEPAAEWWMVCVQFLIFLLSRAMSSYHQEWICPSSDMDWLKCMGQSNKLAQVGNGIGAILLVTLTIWLFVRAKFKNETSV